jgi:hypothetical protein
VFAETTMIVLVLRNVKPQLANKITARKHIGTAPVAVFYSRHHRTAKRQNDQNRFRSLRTYRPATLRETAQPRQLLLLKQVSHYLAMV